MKWYFLLLQDEDRDQFAGHATAPLVTTGIHPDNDYDKADRRKLFS